MFARELPDGKQINEQPGPDNGWTKTVYKRDGKRSGDIVVKESPSARNNWRKIAFEAGPRTVTMVVIDWEILPDGQADNVPSDTPVGK